MAPTTDPDGEAGSVLRRGPIYLPRLPFPPPSFYGTLPQAETDGAMTLRGQTRATLGRLADGMPFHLQFVGVPADFRTAAPEEPREKYFS